MTIEMLEKEESKPRGTDDEMRTLTGFFPLVVACSECEKKMR